jgi:hypothetical protein
MRGRSVNVTHKILRDGEISLRIGFDATITIQVHVIFRKDCSYLSQALLQDSEGVSSCHARKFFNI